MNLFLHLSIHFTLGVVAGLIGWLVTKRFWASMIAGVLAGTLIDLDHLIEYWLVFGWSFNLSHFVQGFEYLESAKMRVVFHGWEYVIMLLAAYWALGRFTRPWAGTVGAILLGVALGFFLHLSADSLINGIPVRSYSIVYRIVHGFEMEKMVTPEHWEEFKMEREEYKKFTLLNK